MKICSKKVEYFKAQVIKQNLPLQFMCYEASLPVQERENFGTYELPEIYPLRLNTPVIFDKYI